MNSLKGVNLLQKIAHAITNISITAKAGTFSDFKVNDLEEVAPITYLGKSEPDSGAWLIQKLDETVSGSVENTFANLSNNGGVTTYSSAWTSRAGLTYNKIETLIF